MMIPLRQILNKGATLTVEVYGDVQEPLAIVIRKGERVDGIKFFCPDASPLQLGLMSRNAGYEVKAHIHNEVERQIGVTQEVLLLRKGSCQVNLFGSGTQLISQIVMSEGDVILLANGGHEIIMIEDCEILEIKQGPYFPGQDKRFLETS